MFGLFEMFARQEYLKECEERRGSAKVLGAEECLRCGYCCERRSCEWGPNELAALAAVKRITPRGCLIQFFLIDRWESRSHYFIRPIGTEQQDLAGCFLPADRGWREGVCIFLQDGAPAGCSIYDYRPESAQRHECWKPSKKGYDPATAEDPWTPEAWAALGLDPAAMEDMAEQDPFDWERKNYDFSESDEEIS